MKNVDIRFYISTNSTFGPKLEKKRPNTHKNGPKSLKIGIFFDNFVQKIVGRQWFVGGPHGGLTLEITWSEFS